MMDLVVRCVVVICDMRIKAEQSRSSKEGPVCERKAA